MYHSFATSLRFDSAGPPFSLIPGIHHSLVALVESRVLPGGTTADKLLILLLHGELINCFLFFLHIVAHLFFGLPRITVWLSCARSKEPANNLKAASRSRGGLQIDVV